MKTIDIAIKEINITKNELKVANKEIIGMAIILFGMLFPLSDNYFIF